MICQQTLPAEPTARSLSLLLLFLVCTGCLGTAPVPRESSFEQGVPEMQPDDEILNISKGEIDSQNRFASTVFVSLSPREGCSGVLIHPRLVLTAGHCVCRGRKDKGTTFIDSSTCEKTATVLTGKDSDTFKPYSGEVLPHRDFKAVLQQKKLLVPPDAKVDHVFIEGDKHYVLVDVVVETRADLALILLNQAVGSRFPPTPPTRTDIQVNDRVVTVGYGANGVEDGLVTYDDRPIRRFGRNTITKTEGELFTIESPGALALPGDSGGPCFRKDPSGWTLVGVNSRSSPGKKATFTSTYRYLSWLAEEIKRAAAEPPGAP